LDLITELIQRAGDRIIVMPGAGITERNIERIVEQSHPREIHIYAPASVQSAMQYRNDRCYMGGELRPPEFSLTVTDPGRVRAFINAAGA
jgi:copper homeostasis protein